MKYNTRSEIGDNKYYENWHKYFAWYPCYCELDNYTGKTVWLEYVYRRKVRVARYNGFAATWKYECEYKEFDLTKE